MNNSYISNRLAVDLCGIKMKNPLLAASGCYGFGLEYREEMDINVWGGICSKAVTLSPKAGNSGERIYETAAGMMNSIGLENPGIQRFCTEILPSMKKEINAAIIVNISGYALEEYEEMAVRLAETAADMLEVNISCPNVKGGGMAFGMLPECAAEVVAAVKKNCPYKPIMVKLTPNAPDVVAVAQACEAAGADAISLVNTFKALAIDVQSRKSVFANHFAGLSGPAIKPLALSYVYEVSKAVSIPVVGLGGIQSATDVLEFILAGASAVQIGTAIFYNPMMIESVVAELDEYAEKVGLKNITELVGQLR